MERFLTVLAVIIIALSFAGRAEAQVQCSDFHEPPSFVSANFSNPNVYIRGEVLRSYMNKDSIWILFAEAELEHDNGALQNVTCVRIEYTKADTDEDFYRMLGSNLAAMPGVRVLTQWKNTGTRRMIEFFRFGAR